MIAQVLVFRVPVGKAEKEIIADVAEEHSNEHVQFIKAYRLVPGRNDSVD
jgi:hypothetical protein